MPKVIIDRETTSLEQDLNYTDLDQNELVGLAMGGDKEAGAELTRRYDEEPGP